jgi:glycosidase
MRGVRRLVDSYANRYMVCEAPGDPLAFGKEDSCGCSFAFGHQNKLVGGALGSPAMLEQVASYFETAPATMATFASNHDGFAGARLWDRMRGDDNAYRLVAATYLLQPGTPFLYYGEEIGLAGGKGLSGDHKLRTPMSWTADAQTGGFTTAEPFRALSSNVATHNVAAQVGDPNSILSFYKSVIALRNSRPSLQKGRYEAPTSTGWVVSFQRVHAGERTVVVLNYGLQAAATTVAGLPAKQALRPLWPAAGRATRSNAQGQARVKLGPQSFAVYAVDAAK